MGNCIIRIFFLFLYANLTMAASCCGGGSSVSGLILNDAKLKTNLTYSNTLYTADVNTKKKSVKRSSNQEEIKEQLVLNISKVINDFNQLSIDFTTNQITKNDVSKKNLGDLKLSHTYEFLPERFYSIWKPRGFSYLAIKLPLGNSKYNSTTTNGVDISTNGLNSIDLGIILAKQINSYSLLFSGVVSNYLKGKFDIGEVKKNRSYDLSTSLIKQIDDTNFSVFSSLSLSSSGAETITTSTQKKTNTEQILMPISIGATYSIDDEKSISLLYQTSELTNTTKNNTDSQLISIGIDFNYF